MIKQVLNRCGSKFLCDSNLITAYLQIFAQKLHVSSLTIYQFNHYYLMIL